MKFGHTNKLQIFNMGFFDFFSKNKKSYNKVQNPASDVMAQEYEIAYIGDAYIGTLGDVLLVTAYPVSVMPNGYRYVKESRVNIEHFAFKLEQRTIDILVSIAHKCHTSTIMWTPDSSDFTVMKRDVMALDKKADICGLYDVRVHASLLGCNYEHTLNGGIVKY